jgi:Kef-type K+ transport system membrane component KefB
MSLASILLPLAQISGSGFQVFGRTFNTKSLIGWGLALVLVFVGIMVIKKIAEAVDDREDGKKLTAIISAVVVFFVALGIMWGVASVLGVSLTDLVGQGASLL